MKLFIASNHKANCLFSLFVMLLFIFLLFGLLLLSGCLQTVKKDSVNIFSGKIIIAGSTTVLPLADAAAQEFTKKHPESKIIVQGGGSSVGIESVSKGTVNIGNSSRELKPEEADNSLIDHKIAIDAVVPIVHPSNNIDNLTSSQLKDIFTGKIRNWKDVGGKDYPIQIINRDEASGTRETVFEKVLDKKDFTKNTIIQPGNAEVVATVSKIKNAIGYCSLGYINNTVKAIRYDGVKASEKTAKNGSFRITRTLHMFTKGEPSHLTKSYLDFVLSDEFQQGTLRQIYVPIK